MSKPDLLPETPTAVVGAGELATALAALAGAGERTVMRRRQIAVAADGEPDWATLASQCRLVLLVVPSQAVRGVARILGDHVGGGHFLVHAARGLEPDTFRPMSEVLREETACLRVGALAGPTIAAEIAHGQPTAAVVASRYPEVVAAARAALGGQTFRVYGSTDVVGVELAAAFSQVVALAAGFAGGLGLEQNARAAVVVRGFAEMARLGAAYGAVPASFTGLAGMGDLLASSQGEASADYRLGRALGRGTAPAEAVRTLEAEGAHPEGPRTVTAVLRMAAQRNVRVHLTEALSTLLSGADPQAVVRGLMTLAPMSEGD